MFGFPSRLSCQPTMAPREESTTMSLDLTASKALPTLLLTLAIDDHVSPPLLEVAYPRSAPLKNVAWRIPPAAKVAGSFTCWPLTAARGPKVKVAPSSLLERDAIT